MLIMLRTPLLLLLCLFWSVQAHAVSITCVSDHEIVTFQQLTAKAKAADMVLIGEVHDKPAAHELQLSIIRSLQDHKQRMAIGMEVMQSNSQQQLDDWVSGKMTEEQFQHVFAQNWTYDWRLYRDIFLFARDNKIPLIALNVPRETVIKVSRQGYKALTEEERKGLPAGTNADLNNTHTEFLKRAFQPLFESVSNGRVFQYFCEAQTLRNSGMAMTAAHYVEQHPKTKMVLLTGIWHAVKNAIPEQLDRSGHKMSSVVIMPEIQEFSGGKATADVIDYLVQLPTL